MKIFALLISPYDREAVDEAENQICAGTDQLLTLEMGLSARGGQHLDAQNRGVWSRPEVPMPTPGDKRRSFTGMMAIWDELSFPV